MPCRECRRALKKSKALERKAQLFQQAQAPDAEEIAGEKRWKKWHAPQKRKFFCKKQKKARHLAHEIFCDCFCAAVGVWYYGCVRGKKTARSDEKV